MEQNKELRQAWDFVEHTGTSIFLTGKAGTGKTTFLKMVKEHSSKRMIVVAPTGVAAINAGGVTIHSFFQLPLSPYVPGTKFQDKFDFGKERRRIIRTLDMLVIDEISMVRSDLLDAVDMILRRYRDRTRPFGGVQLLMIGDLQQLTPVVTPQDEVILRAYYDTPYFYGSKALQQISYVTIQLTQVYRQQDQTFINILNHIRDGHPTEEDIARLNKRCQPSFVPKAEEGYIRLSTHNRMADSYNENELAKLSGKMFDYKAEIEGLFPENNYPAEVNLELKLGAQVMFLKNDPSGAQRYYNGRIGHVVAITDDSIEVMCVGDGKAIKVEPQEWQNTKYAINPSTHVIEEQVQGVFRQYPLRLAWAITIHKSQGLTFDRAIIDAALSFASGQVYVALSRCKSMEGLVLASPIVSRNIINDNRVADYISHQQDAAEDSIRALPTLKEEYFRYQLLDLFDFTNIYSAQQAVYRTLVEYFHGMPKLTTYHGQIVQALKKKLMDVAYKWQSVIRGMSPDALHEEVFLIRVKNSVGYFLNVLEEQMGDALEKMKGAKTGNEKGMQLLDERYKEMWLEYLSKDKVLRKMEEETFDVPVYMLAKQEAMLDAMDVVNPDSRSNKPRRRRRTAESPWEESISKKKKAQTADKPKEKREASHAITYQMLCNGKRPEDIANDRELTITTIYSHLSNYVKMGKLSAEKVIDASKVRAIRHAISQLPEDASLKDIKAACRSDISWDEIRLIKQSL